MPLFRRSDGDLITDLSDERRMMPYIMRGRNESAVYHNQRFNLTETRKWLRAYNRNRDKNRRASLFQLFTYACAKTLNERPGMNRFVAGGRIYQRRHVWLSFVVKKRLVDGSPLVTIKLKFPANESFSDCLSRLNDAVNEGRSDRNDAIERELRFLNHLPGPLLRTVLAAGRCLDRFNLLPSSLIEPDPLYTSMFLTNSGSVGLGNAYHHLYEHGTCSVHAVVGSIHKATVVDLKGRTEVCEVLDVNWTFDERVNDGFYSSTSLIDTRRLMENPARYVCDAAAPSAIGDEAPQ